MLPNLWEALANWMALMLMTWKPLLPKQLKKLNPSQTHPLVISILIHFIREKKLIYFFEKKASREASPIRASDRASRYRNDLDNMRCYDYINGNGRENGTHLHNGHMSPTDPSDDEYIDTVEVMITLIRLPIIELM